MTSRSFTTLLTIILLSSPKALSQDLTITRYGDHSTSSVPINVGSGNSFFGYDAGPDVVSQSGTFPFIDYDAFKNSFFGAFAGNAITTGDHNVFLGYNSGGANVSGSHNIFIGYSAGSQELGSNKLYIDNSGTSSPLIWGDFAANVININGKLGVGTTSPTMKFQVNTTGTDPARAAFTATGSGIAGVYFDAANGDLAGGDYGSLIQNNDLSIELNNYGPNPLHFRTSGANRLTVLGNGNVGIGTDSPSFPLDVNGNMGVTGDLTLTGHVNFSNNSYLDDDTSPGGTSDDWLHFNGYLEMRSNTDNYGIVLRDKDASDYLGITQRDGQSYFSDNGVYSNYFLKGNGANVYTRGDLYVEGDDIYSNSGTLYLNGEDDVRIAMDYNNNDADSRSILFGKNDRGLSTDWLELMRIQESGNVGIGTTSPANKLSVAGGIDVNDYLRHSGDTDTYLGFSGDDQITLQTKGVERLVVEPNGRIGIGRTPSFELDMSGTLRTNAIRGTNSGGALKVETDHGYVQLGPRNDTNDRMQFITDRDHFYFNRTLRVLGQIDAHNADLSLRTTSNALTVKWSTANTHVHQDLIAEGNVDMVGALRHEGDLDTWMGFGSNDEISFNTAGTERLVVRPDGSVGVGRTPDFPLDVNGATRTHSIRGIEDGDALKIQTQHGYVNMGPQNPSWAHFATDRPKYLFDKPLYFEGGEISTLNSDMVISVSGDTAIVIDNVDEDITVKGDLILEQNMKLNKSYIREDNSYEDLLVMNSDGSLATREVQSIESPWLFEEILVGQDSILRIICPDTTVVGEPLEVGQVLVDVIDLNGNIKIGPNSYIDDDLDPGDNGDDPDDWMKFTDWIEFKSVSDSFGIRLYDKTSYLDFLNLHHSNGTSYLSNGSAHTKYFMKSVGRNVTFADTVSIPNLKAGNAASDTTFILTIDNDNNSVDEAHFTIRRDGNGFYDDIFRVGENGDVNVLIGNLEIDTGNVQLGMGDLLVEDGSGYFSDSLVAKGGRLSHDLVLRDLWGRRGDFKGNVSAVDFLASGDGHFTKAVHADSVIANWGYYENDVRLDNLTAAGNGTFTGHVAGDSLYTAHGANVAGLLTSGSLNTGAASLAATEISSTLTVAGASDLNGGLSTTTITASGSSALNGGATTTTLTASGAAALNGGMTTSTITASGLSTLNGGVTTTTVTANSGTVQGTLRSGGIQITALAADETPYSEELAVFDENGVIQKRHISTFNLSPWTMDNYGNISFTTGLTGVQGLESSVYGSGVSGLSVRGNGSEVFRVDSEGFVQAKKLKLRLTGWSDFVFRSGYHLRPLEELEAFIAENEHLPDVPSEAEVLEEGVEVGAMQSVLLQKIEELTLYIIDQNKQLKTQDQQLKDQESEIDQLKQLNALLLEQNDRIAELERRLDK